ncbi:hypothetical protein AX17_003865 [Amanita inopinata Kibby_2008]|nr:hypothetical protein AX17_003865 [Amanita inopinata Kibby_2008]
MVRTFARSQRSRRARNSQPEPSQVSLYQDGEAEEDHEQEQEVEVEGGGDVNMDQDVFVASAESDVMRKASDLVRLALFAEQRRTPLRREEILKKVLGPNTRLFNRVFTHANHILRTNFGMGLIELPTRGSINQNDNNDGDQGDELDEARKVTGWRKKATVAGSKTYILRSTLDPRLIEIAAQTDEQILEDEALDAPEDDDDDDDAFSEGGHTPRYYGSLISWTRGDQIGALGVLYVILALILVNGRVIPDMDLRANLKRLRLPTGGEVAFSALSTHKTLTVDQYLSTLLRQNYIDREQVGEGKIGKGKGNKRGRVATQAPQDDEEGTTYQWRWGPRAYCEVGEKAIAKFVAEFMVGKQTDAEGDEEEQGRDGSSRRARGKERPSAGSKVEKMLEGIEKAAGGNLTDLR